MNNRVLHLPPVLAAPTGSALDDATKGLIAALTPMGKFLAELPASAERDAAVARFNESVMWAHQALARDLPGRIALFAGHA